HSAVFKDVAERALAPVFIRADLGHRPAQPHPRVVGDAGRVRRGARMAADPLPGAVLDVQRALGNHLRGLAGGVADGLIHFGYPAIEIPAVNSQRHVRSTTPSRRAEASDLWARSRMMSTRPTRSGSCAEAVISTSSPTCTPVTAIGTCTSSRSASTCASPGRCGCASIV